MKIEKNKIVFGSVVIIVILFIIAYSALVLMGEEEGSSELDQPTVPALKEEKETYTSRMDALNDLKEVRQSDPPSIYSEKLLDSLGVYDPLLEEKERERIVDSIYDQGRINYQEMGWSEDHEEYEPPQESNEAPEVPMEIAIASQDFSVKHKEFFRPRPISVYTDEKSLETDTLIPARVNGEQQVGVNDRLELILSEDAVINGRIYSRNTLLYGFVRFQPNRVHIEITHIQNKEAKLKAFDLQDSNEGIYVKNSFRAEATNEVIGDVIQDINIAGLPQIGGIKNVFTRKNRNIKVTVMDQYQLILKPEL